jgi:hypothetical protein
MQNDAQIKSAIVSKIVQRLAVGPRRFATFVAAPTKNTSMMTSLVAKKNISVRK